MEFCVLKFSKKIALFSNLILGAVGRRTVNISITCDNF